MASPTAAPCTAASQASRRAARARNARRVSASGHELTGRLHLRLLVRTLLLSTSQPTFSKKKREYQDPEPARIRGIVHIAYALASSGCGPLPLLEHITAEVARLELGHRNAATHGICSCGQQRGRRDTAGISARKDEETRVAIHCSTCGECSRAAAVRAGQS